MEPANSLEEVRALAANQAYCEIFQTVLISLRSYGLDSDDLLEILQSEIGERHCYKSAATQKYHPNTISDYYSIWIDDCSSQMFIKLLVASDQHGTRRLVVTSFKRDVRYG